MSNNRRPMWVLGCLMGGMTFSALMLHLFLPTGGAPREPATVAAGRGPTEPLSTTGPGPDHGWSRIEVRLADAEEDDSDFHFVISAEGADLGAVTSVQPLWRRQQVSPLEGDKRPGDGVYIALLSDADSRGPTAAQWQALGLLVKQLRGRYGLSRVGFDAPLDADPHSRGLRVAAAW